MSTTRQVSYSAKIIALLVVFKSLCIHRLRRAEPGDLRLWNGGGEYAVKSRQWKKCNCVLRRYALPLTLATHDLPIVGSSPTQKDSKTLRKIYL